ncbi:MAG: divalent-cation tolerance protein CutA, partial [Hansschlegelia sp.]
AGAQGDAGRGSGWKGKRMTEFVVVVTTVDDRAVADRIAEAVIGRGLAACARISSAESVYRWNGELQRTAEFVLEIKTRAASAAAVEAAIVELHSYELPEVVVTPILGGSSSYLAWMRQETTPR